MSCHKLGMLDQNFHEQACASGIIVEEISGLSGRIPNLAHEDISRPSSSL